MIVVRVELWSAATGKVTELARAVIVNDGTGTAERRNYDLATLRGRSTQDLNKSVPQRKGKLTGWPSERLHVWNLVAAMLTKLGYGAPGDRGALPKSDLPF